MIGAGVFTTSGLALADLGSPYRVLAAWLVGGALALCGALSYGALVRVMPESGGEYVFLSRTIHPAAGFVAGWISLLAGFTSSIAFSAMTFAAYAAPQASAAADKAVATLVLGVAVLLHALRVRQGAWVQNAAVALKVALMLGFCAYAVLGVGVASWTGLEQLRAEAYDVPPFAVAPFALTLMWISFSYLGFNAAVYIAEEVPAARDSIPRALVLGTLVTTAVYLVLNAVFMLVPAYADVAGTEDVAAAAARALGDETFATAARLVIALALFTSVSAMVMIGPRVYAKMADDGLFPSALRFEGETPRTAILAQAALAAVVVWLTGLRELLSYLGFTLSLCTAATVAALFVAVRREPALAARLPGFPWAPALFVAFTLLVAGLGASVEPREMVAGIVTIVTGLVLYLLVRGRRAAA